MDYSMAAKNETKKNNQILTIEQSVGRIAAG
jgi:hypothetical protein